MPFASCIAGNKPHAYKPSATLGNSLSCMRNKRKASFCLSTQQIITESYLHVGRRYIELLIQSIWQTLQYALLLLLLHSLVVLLLLNSLIVLLLLLNGLVQLLLLHGLVVL